MVELGERSVLPEAAIIRLFNPNRPRDWAAAKKLDVTSLYAHNPYAMGEANSHRPMTSIELKRFISKGDQNHQTRAISNSKDSLGRAIGFEYFSRTDPDDMARLPFVRRMIEDAGIDITRKTKIFDYNFDLPDRADYVELGMSAVKQGLEEFFRRNPDAGVVFYFEHNDLMEDPDDYNIMTAMGATDVGQINYEHPGKSGTLEKPNDHALYLDRSHFEGRVRKQATKPRNYAATSLPTLHALQHRATGGK